MYYRYHILIDETSSIISTSMANAKDTTVFREQQLTTLTTVGIFNNSRIESELNEELKNSYTDVYIAVGVIVGLIILLLITLIGVRYFKSRSKLNNSSESSTIKEADALYSTPDNMYEVMSTTKPKEMVVNELYVSSDAKNSRLAATTTQDASVCSMSMKKINAEEKNASTSQANVSSTSAEKQKPEMVDNVLYKSFNG